MLKAILCNKTWRVFSDNGEKEVYIFMEDGKLVISVNGSAVIGSWMYIPANQSLVISGNNQHFLVHPIICNNVLALALDGSNQCCFLIDSTKEELDSINSLRSIESYISKNANKMPLLTHTEVPNIRNVVIEKPIPSDAIYATDQRFKFYWVPTSCNYVKRLFIKSLFTYKEFTGTIYTSRHHYEIEYTNGELSRMYIFHPNKQLAGEVYVNDGKDEEHFYDENGYELTKDVFGSRYGDVYERLYENETNEIGLIPDGGKKD